MSPRHRRVIQHPVIMLRDSIRKLKEKKHIRLILYRGVILPASIDIGKSDVLGQALRNAPGQIHRVAVVGFDLNNSLSPTETIDSVILAEIQPILKIIRNYFQFIFNTLNFQPRQEVNHE